MSADKQITILIAHHDPLTRAGLHAALSGIAGFHVAPGFESHESVAELLRMPARSDIDVVVADYAYGMAFAASTAPFKVFVLSAADREWDIRRALQCGIRGYVIAGSGLQEIVAGVRAVGRGARHLSPIIAQRLADSMTGESLTGREEDTLQLIVEGLCNKAIARRLGITVGTVKSHLKSAFGKLNVQSRTQAAAAIERRGLLGMQRGADQLRPDSSHQANLPQPSFRSGAHQANRLA